MQRADDQPTRHPLPATRYPRRVALLSVVVVAVAAAGAYFAYDQYQLSRLSGTVRRLFVARRYEEARGFLQRWIQERPRSAEAQYFRAWLGLIDDQPSETVAAIEQATRLGLDPNRLLPLTAIYQARAGKINEAEPILRKAFAQGREPLTEVAKELARIYLTTYRLAQASEAIERWRALAPEDPQPYLWDNEIASRSESGPAILMRNYRAALERDPSLDKAAPRPGQAAQQGATLRRGRAGISQVSPPQPQGCLGTGGARPHCLPERRSRRCHEVF